MPSNDFTDQRGGQYMRFFKNIKMRWNAYLKRMGEANSKNYGDNRLNCCTLNQNNEPVNQTKPKDSSGFTYTQQ